MSVKIFISHKESEVEIAKRLIDFLESAIEVADGGIRCSSVPGYQLTFGTTISKQLKDDIHQSTAVIALLSHESVHSEWVLFELGASWALSKILIPILSPGLSVSALPGPLSEYPAIMIEKNHSVTRLLDAIDQISKILNLRKKPSSMALTKLNEFIEFYMSKYWFLDKTSPKYNNKNQIINQLLDSKVILSSTDREMAEEWIVDENSGYPDIARKLLIILSDVVPKGNTVVLDAIMGRYRNECGKELHEFTPPPYDIETTKKAYVKNWRERNTGEYSTLPEDIKNNYRKLFIYITTP